MNKLIGLFLCLAASTLQAADTRIQDYPAASALTGSEVVPGVQGVNTRKISAAQISTYSRSQTTKSDVGLGNVDNTSDATKNAASATLTNKTISGASNTLSNISLTSAVTGTLPVANGGTGQTSLSALTANPTASVGPTATNGSASTFMRSDAAPAVDLTAAYTWTGNHTASGSEPRRIFIETDQGTDLKNWDWDLQAGVYCLRTRTDADGAGQNAICATRGTTTAISNVSLGNATNNPTGTFLGTGTFTFGGQVTTPRVNVNGSTVPTTGIYQTGSNLGFATSGANQATLSSASLTMANDSSLAVSGTGRVRTGNGAAATPPFTATADQDTGIFFPGADRLAIVTGGTQRFEVSAAGQAIINTVGAGLSIAEGSNAKMGTCTLVAGACTVSTTAVTSSSRIFLTAQSLGTVTVGQGLAVSGRTAGTSFTVTSGAPTDTSTVAWIIVEPGP